MPAHGRHERRVERRVNLELTRVGLKLEAIAEGSETFVDVYMPGAEPTVPRVQRRRAQLHGDPEVFTQASNIGTGREACMPPAL